MRGLRFLLIVVLAAVMDLGSPVLPEVGEASEELEEAAHGRRRLMLLRHAVSPIVPATVTPAALTARRPGPRPSPARATRAPARKIPPLPPDPAIASEDH
jgi:hypothetical protein